jgi:hypothetical protein
MQLLNFMNCCFLNHPKRMNNCLGLDMENPALLASRRFLFASYHVILGVGEFGVAAKPIHDILIPVRVGTAVLKRNVIH